VKFFLKAVLMSVGLVLILIGVGALFACSQADRWGSPLAARYLTNVFQSQVSVDGMSVYPLLAAVEIRGISVENPEGFAAGEAMRIPRTRIRFDAMSLFSDTPVIDSILVEDADVTLHYELGNGTNLGTLARNARTHAAAVEVEAEAEPVKAMLPEAPEPVADAHRTDAKESVAPRWTLDEAVKVLRRLAEGSPVKKEFLIRSLHSEGAKVRLTANVAPRASIDLDVAPFDLEGVSKENPVTAGDMSASFIRSLLREAVTFNGLLSSATALVRSEIEDLGG
jgi:uncharacterized protein involved in outer membrane biogenesis